MRIVRFTLGYSTGINGRVSLKNVWLALKIWMVPCALLTAYHSCRMLHTGGDDLLPLRAKWDPPLPHAWTLPATLEIERQLV